MGFDFSAAPFDSDLDIALYEELLADAGGKYYELWNAHAQYYVAG